MMRKKKVGGSDHNPFIVYLGYPGIEGNRDIWVKGGDMDNK